MAVYLHLSKLTREGAAKIRDLGSSYSTWKSFAESQGAKIVCAAACFGEYDFAVVADYPNEVAECWMRHSSRNGHGADPSLLRDRRLRQSNE